MMVYSYLLVVVPVLALLAPIAGRIGGLPVVAGIVAGQALLGPILASGQGDVWSQNLSFLILLGAWLAYLSIPRRTPSTGRGRRPTASK
jgi:hypothetical protein